MHLRSTSIYGFGKSDDLNIEVGQSDTNKSVPPCVIDDSTLSECEWLTKMEKPGWHNQI